MVKLFLKNIRYKCIVFFIVMMVVFYTLTEFEGLDADLALRSVFGGNQLYRPMIIISFMIFIALIQYLHIDSIMIILKNDTYLSIRYKNYSPIFRKLLINMFFTNLVCVALTACAWYIMLIIGSHNVSAVEWGTVFEILSRGYLTCTIVIIVQSIFLLQWNEMSTFLGMIIFSAVFVVLSYMGLGIINICPFRLDTKMLIVNVGLCVVYILIGLFFYRKKYKEREIGKYGN